MVDRMASRSDHPRWDIFCRVIDNFGDMGVSWRLARQLATEHAIAVRLWVDQLVPLAALSPQTDVRLARQEIDGVEVALYDPQDATAHYPPPANVVIDAFGCGLPPRYVAAMSEMPDAGKPLWIVLEYLSAESWVSAHHGLPSPHPQFDLPRYFFFPGVDMGTGGVLREADLLARQEAFDGAARQRWWSTLGFPAPTPGALTLSLFAYPHAPLAELIEVCSRHPSPTVVAIPAGALAQQARHQLDAGTADRVKRGHLELRFLPFLPQVEYDNLLWACDINFVRGEDSFVRAQWAGRPFVWHIYPQTEQAHERKLDAFLARYGAALPAQAAASVREMWLAWNGVTGAAPLATAWAAFRTELQGQRLGLSRWQEHLMQVGDLAGNLLKFCGKML